MVVRIPAEIDPHLICVTGAIVFWWGRIENDLYLDLLTTRKHPLARALAVKKSIPPSSKERIKQWARVRKAIFAQDLEKIRRTDILRERLLSASTERNEIVHSFWPYGNKKDPKRLRLQNMMARSDGSHAFKEIEINPETLEDLSERLNHLYHEIMGLTVSFAFENSKTPRDYKA